MTEDDLMLNLALIAEFYSDPKQIKERVRPFVKKVPRSRRLGLYKILESTNPHRLIMKAVVFYEEAKDADRAKLGANERCPDKDNSGTDPRG